MNNFTFYHDSQVISAPFARRPQQTGYSSDGDTDEEQQHMAAKRQLDFSENPNNAPLK